MRSVYGTLLRQCFETEKSVYISKLETQLLLWFVLIFFFLMLLFKSVVLWDFIMTNFKDLMTATDSLGVEKHMYTFIKRDTQLQVI